MKERPIISAKAEEDFITRIKQGIKEADAGRGFTTEDMLDRASQRYLGKAYNG